MAAARGFPWYLLGLLPLGYWLLLAPGGPHLGGLVGGTDHGSCAEGNEQAANHGIDSSNGVLHRVYEWQFDGRDWTYRLDIDEGTYERVRDSPRAMRLVTEEGQTFRAQAYDAYVLDARDDQFLAQVAASFSGIAADEGWNELERASFVLSFVQCLAYTDDSATAGFDEYPRYPLETLVENGGDCEDTSILYASLLKAMGTEVILVGPPGHMAAAVAVDAAGSSYTVDGTVFYYAETTGSGHGIGDLPEAYRDARAKVFRLDPRPVITLEVTPLPREGTLQSFLVNATNLGLATAHGVKLTAQVQDTVVYASDGCTPEDLAPFMRLGCTVTFDYSRVPQGSSVQVVSSVVADGFLVDRRFSEPFTARP
jgi:predicted transglutaminase-like cysteine proteinase